MAYISPASRDRGAEPPWQRAAAIAQRQGRSVTIEQLRACGLTGNRVTRAVRAGHVARVHPRVYVLGPARLTPDEARWAAYLAGGPGALVSHNSARALLGIRPWTGAPHITTPSRHRPLRGAFVHTGRVSREHMTSRSGMRLTGIARTLADCAPLTPLDALIGDVETAIDKDLITFSGLADAIRTLRGHHGLARLSAALGDIADDPGEGRSHSEMERLFARLAAQLPGLPPYVRNRRLTLPDGRTVVPDAYFPDARAWIELDSRTWHQQRRAMDADRRRDQRAMSLGYLPYRLT